MSEDTISMETYLTKLREMARLRSISIDAKGDLHVRSLPDECRADGLSLDVQVEPTFLLDASQCQPFEATTVKIPVPLSLAVAGPMIDPERWGEFSAVKTSNAIKQPLQEPGSTGWTGTIEERVRVRFGSVVTDYHNRLGIEFRIRSGKARVDFTLKECFEGDLAFEEGFFEIEPHAFLPVVTLVSKKALLYKPPSEWCRLPEPLLRGILQAWLNAATAEYALRMTTLGAGEWLHDLASRLIDELP